MSNSINETPRGLRKQVGIFGKTNAGKSTLFNLITGQENAIISEREGTTTDPVFKNMELNPYGAITIIDTAGLCDQTELGKLRADKTVAISRRVDVGIFVCDVSLAIKAMDGGENLNVSCIKGEKSDGDNYFKKIFGDDDFHFEKIYVFTKCDTAEPEKITSLKQKYDDVIFMSNKKSDDVILLRNKLIKKLESIDKKTGNNDSDTLVGDFLKEDSVVVMVVPLDSAAPKGRLILPQVQLIRDCLDHNINTVVVRESSLHKMLPRVDDVSLVVTDSQIFPLVNSIVDKEIPLTSFSILLARQKSGKESFGSLIEGAYQTERLKDGDRILMMEGCTHNHTHEDIGRVKIPNLIQKHTGKKIEFDFFSGYDIPENINKYSMAIMCGGCMINKREIKQRLWLLEKAKVPTTNYGIILAYLSGILERCLIW